MGYFSLGEFTAIIAKSHRRTQAKEWHTPHPGLGACRDDRPSARDEDGPADSKEVDGVFA